MVNVYLSVSDVSGYLNKTYSTTSNPTTAQMEKYITIGEKEFENEVGVYTTTDNTLYLRASRNGLILPIIPNTITKVYSSDGVKVNPTYTQLSSDDYEQSNEDNRIILLKYPYVGYLYKVEFTSGYDYADMPEHIKYLVFLYAMRSMFEKSNINEGGSDVTTTIDVDVYKKVTRSSPLKGFQALYTMIEDRKKSLMQSGNLKVYTKWYG